LVTVAAAVTLSKRKKEANMTVQLMLLPDLADEPSGRGKVYLMTDGRLLKWGYTSRSLRQRSGELRAQVIGWKPGIRADEAALHRMVSQWGQGGEWFKLPDHPVTLHAFLRVVDDLQPWRGIPVSQVFARVLASNLRRAA
jgi:hypothetical protein